MALLALGINHKTAHVSIRERVAFAPEQMPEALQGALTGAGLNEVVILSTCNRTELFAIVDCDEATLEPQLLMDWLGGYHHIPGHELAAHCYHYVGSEAVRHMIEVAAGLDSMVLGEPQIFGQMKSAYAVAREVAAVGSELSRVFPHVFSVAKKVRTDTAIGENPVSVAYAAVNLSHHIFADLSKTRALLVGAGETIELVAQYLSEQNVAKIVVANRTLGRARELAQRFGAEAVLLGEVPEQLLHADIVITSTASQLPILGKGAVEQALKSRKHRPILMVDIAVPRDIEEQVGELNDVYLYTIDDLTDIVNQNRRNRESEARKADEIIAEGVERYVQQLRALDGVSMVKVYRARAEQLRDAELEKAIKQLARGDDPQQVATQLARSLTNKLIHSPSTKIRQASAEGRSEILALTQELFELIRHEDDI